MAIKYLAGNVIQGLSSDTKPTNVPAGSVFVETDTQRGFLFIGGIWNFSYGIPTNVLTVAPTGADFATPFDALAAQPASTPTLISVAPGLYSTPSSKLLSITQSNTALIGPAKGAANIQADSSFTGSTPLLSVQGSAVGASYSLTVSTAPGNTSVTVSASDSTNFAAGQYALVRSNKQTDFEFPSHHAGEIVLITAVNNTTGVISLHDEVYDSYLTTDSASIIQVSPLKNVTVQGLTFSTLNTSSGLSQGTIFARFLKNFNIQECEMDHLWWAGLQLSSCLDSRVEDLFIHDTQDPSGGSGSTHYGIVVHSACKGIVVGRCQFSVTRHGYTMGGSSGGTNYEGIPRNVSINNCTSEMADSAHFDTHQCGENVVFNACTAIGGTAATGETGVKGFQCRSPKTTFNGCKSVRATSKAFYLFGQAAYTNLNGCTVNNCQQFSAAGGDAVYLEAAVVYSGGTCPAVTGVAINGGVFKDCDGHILTGTGNNDDCTVQGCEIINMSGVTTDGNIRLVANNVLVQGNRFKGGPNRPIQMLTTSDNWTIIANDFTGMNNTAPVITNNGSRVKDNIGYNPVSPTTPLATPFPTSGAGNLTNLSQAAAAPATNTDQTIRWTPKTIIITGGTYTGSGLVVNGTQLSAAAGNFFLKLGIGEKFNVSYTVAPTISVFIE